MFSLRRLFAVAVLAPALAAAGCTGAGQVRHDTAKEAYQNGMDAFEGGDYEEATTYFRAVFEYGRENEWADDAQLQLARAYREDGRHLLAAQQFRRFARLYRNDERAPLAEYQQAMSYYRLSPDYELDQSHTKKALNLFQLFADRYPQHEHADTVEENIAELRGKLARKQLAAARQYERRELWEASADAFEDVFNQYPDTRWVDEALLGAVRTSVAYADRSIASKQAERYRRAVDNYRRLEQIFPDSPLLDKAAAHYETARKRLEEIDGEDAQPLAETGE